MDLLKVFPDALKMITDPNQILWTLGNTSNGRLNHPTVWNSHGAFLFLQKPDLQRDAHGWFNILGHVGNAQEVECTWLEFLRDAWCHHFSACILPSGVLLPAPPDGCFMEMMYDTQGRSKSRELSPARQKSISWIVRCDSALEGVKAQTLGANGPTAKLAP